jgi:arylsulfatase A-like enzyme
MYRLQDMPLPVWNEGEEAGWPEAYRRKHHALGDGHEAVGLDGFTDDDWRRIKAYYYGMVSQIDVNVGRLIGTLRRQGQLENTVIVFTTDHGENLGDHRLLFKGTTYDCVTRVPFVVSWPGCEPAGEMRDVLCSSIDIMPTVLDLAGVPHPEPSPMQGTSLVPAMEDTGAGVREALLIENGGLRRSVRTEHALLTWHGQGERGELYDLVSDPNCFHNLWDQPEAVELQSELMDTLVRLMAENVDPLPVREGPW